MLNLFFSSFSATYFLLFFLKWPFSSSPPIFHCLAVSPVFLRLICPLFFASLKTLQIIHGCSFSPSPIIPQQLSVKEKLQVSHFPVCIELWAKDWTWCREELTNQPSFTARFMFKRIQKNESFPKLIIHCFVPWGKSFQALVDELWHQQFKTKLCPTLCPPTD